MMDVLWNALRWGRSDGVPNTLQSPLQPFRLPSPLSDWPAGTGFATKNLCCGDLDIAEVTNFEEVWSACRGGPDNRGASFFKPIDIASGYRCLGYYCQANTGTLDGWVLVAKASDHFASDHFASERASSEVLSAQGFSEGNDNKAKKPPLTSPIDYTLIWDSTALKKNQNGVAFIWLPCALDGYVPVGCVVTDTPQKPSLLEVMCVRIDLTDACKTAAKVWSTESSESPFTVWNVYPCRTGLDERGISVGTFCCSRRLDAGSDLPISCLKNTGSVFSSMPNAEQIHALMLNYGPVFYFHPDEVYFPSSVAWFFEQGALLCKKDAKEPEKLACDGCNLPVGTLNEGELWIALPDGEIAETIKKGNLASAKGYVQVKPMLGGTFTDLVIWVYYPFNGPSTAKLGIVDLPLGKIGEHVSDWEHVTLRTSNLSGHLRKVYFAQHSGGRWMNASEVEYACDNNVAVYSARSGHASYPHPGLVLQGNKRIAVGIRNDTAPSDYILETAKNYEIISAAYLRSLGADNTPNEPTWLLFPCHWGPKIQYDKRAKFDKVLQRFPRKLRGLLQSFVNKFPQELSGEEGPTGPMQKNYWLGDERVKYH